MSYVSEHILPKSVLRKDVCDFLLLLGYKKQKKGIFKSMAETDFYYYYSFEHYRYITGVEVTVYKESGHLKISTRTNASRSKFDCDFQNYTIKQLKKRFRGGFYTDFGKNRYFKYYGVVRDKAEAGVFKAFEFFYSNLNRVFKIIDFADLQPNIAHKRSIIPLLDYNNPRIILSNILVPFVISSIEDLFKSIYIVLLKYSPEKNKIIAKQKPNSLDLLSIECGEMSVVEAVAKSKSFQNMSKVNTHFKEINNKIDIHALLKKPFGRKKESQWELFNRLINLRHEIIHEALLDIDFQPKNLHSDIQGIKKSVEKIQIEINKIYKWPLAHKGNISY